MDPNKVLMLLREVVRRLELEDNPDTQTELAYQVASYFDVLDAWLTKGGFLPKEWER